MKRMMKAILFAVLCCMFVLCAKKDAGAQVKNIAVSNNQTTNANVTVGDSGKFLLEGSEWWDNSIKVSYSCYDNEALQVNQDGTYKTLKAAYATVFVRAYDDNYNQVYNATIQFSIVGDVSNMKLEKTKYEVARTSWYDSMSVQIPLINAPDLSYYSFTYTSSNAGMGIYCSLDPSKKCLVVTSSQAGTTQITFVINGKTYVVTVSFYEPTINKVTLVLGKGKKSQLKVKGYKGKVVWNTMNKKICTVSSKGLVKAKKKVGTTVVYFDIQGRKVGCAVSVVTSKIKKVINKAYSIAKGKYSQAKRMQKGYYDCSSLVWRAYQKAGKSLGNKNYAPVAADIAKYLFGKKKRIKGGLSYSNIQKMKLRPGDLFFEGGAQNGRYKGIYHVEMFTGYACGGFDEKGKPILLACWAARPVGSYFAGMVGRP